MIWQKYLKNCKLCPRNCGVNKIISDKGVCRTKTGYYISSVVVHKGEEPPISGDKGICNVFFAHCNLQCVYCQNYQISRNNINIEQFKMSYEQVLDRIIEILEETGINIVGFVSPSHFVVETIEIIEGLYKRGYFPTIVYNTNAYDKVETLQMLEKYVDVYLPDMKYMDSRIAAKYSRAKDYPTVAVKAIEEMYRQKGDLLLINKDGYVHSGLIIRHLVLPGNIENSLAVLRFIASLSKDIHISLMAQYYPTAEAYKYPEINRVLTQKEYEVVVNELEKLGLSNGWIQDLESSDIYRPDFSREYPFGG